MGDTLTYKILREHLVSGNLKPLEQIEIKIDQTLTQDSTGTMVYLELEAMNIKEVKTEKSVAYIDHNTLQTGFENADDHAFIKSVAKRHGVIFQKPGGGICHQLHMENYGVPGKTLIGSDSHTPTCGGIGMIAIGAGGLDVATAMAVGTYKVICPFVYGVKLSGKLRNGVSAKDVILKVLKELTVKGGVNKIIEYHGDGVKSLSATDRATITNMGAELGATTSIFPSDDNTLEYLNSVGRKDAFVPLSADSDASYDDYLEINLDELEPLTAMPHSPDNVEYVKNLKGLKIDQVAIGSCTNSSYADLMKVAMLLDGKKIHEDVSLIISPGSAMILSELAKNGALKKIIDSGARVIENACGPCIGMGGSPKSGAISLRTFNRNFKGRSGTLDADIYLVSPETAVLSAIKGELTDAVSEKISIDFSAISLPMFDCSVNKSFAVNQQQDALLDHKVEQGPNIKPFPINTELEPTISTKVVLKTGDNITTDDIMPSDSSLLPFRSNIPHLSKFCFHKIDSQFPERANENGGGIIIGGENYGQGSSREHAALAPLYLNIKAVIAKSFARIHRSNLINSGIIPMVFISEGDYDNFNLLDEIRIDNLVDSITDGKDIEIENKTARKVIKVRLDLSKEEKKMILKGGKIKIIQEEVKNG